MKKNIVLCSLLFLAVVGYISAQTSSKIKTTRSKDLKPIYSFTVKDIQGKKYAFEQLKGKKIMIVNTASKCGLTPQYKSLEMLYQKYKDKNFIIIGFPANNFAEQEPGSDKEIETFCLVNYGVSFPMMSKISVAGADEAPLYHYLKNQSENGFSDSEVKWNFQKYLINEQGFLEKVISPKTDPLDVEILSWIEK